MSSDLPTEQADRFLHPLARFLRVQAAAGSVLLLCAVVALAFANSPWSAAYLALWETPVGVRWGTIDSVRSLRHWIDDGAMTLFFFVVALELKRELVLGELRDRRLLALPLAAALGGMLVPAGLFLLLAAPGEASRGWGVVMATDTAFVIGCLALLGSRIPSSLRLFLLSLAIFDDIGAILVIAFVYGLVDTPMALIAAGAVLAGIVLARWLGIRHIAVYITLGVGLWLAFDSSGIHPTVAGVLLGLATPARRWISDTRLHAILGRLDPAGDASDGRSAEGQRDLQRAVTATREASAPLERIEFALHPWVAFVVLPLFALANTGIDLSWSGIDGSLAIAVVVGLALGKPTGVVAFGYAAARLGLARLPRELDWPMVSAGALLTGIGFTMSLLIAELALGTGLLVSAKVGVLIASLLSATVGVATLAWLTSRSRRR